MARGSNAWIHAGRQMKAARARTGLTQTEIADKLQVARVSISRWERGRSCPESGRLRQFSELTGADYAQLAAAWADRATETGAGHERAESDASFDSHNDEEQIAEALIAQHGLQRAQEIAMRDYWPQRKGVAAHIAMLALAAERAEDRRALPLGQKLALLPTAERQVVEEMVDLLIARGRSVGRK